ncbi:MAG: DUF3426 domain-containing protein [Pseudorhodoferax sp.]
MAQLITRCPACGTRFRVVPDQLRISEGWVRCGHCAEVFDAARHLGAPEEAAPAALPTAEPVPEPALQEPRPADADDPWPEDAGEAPPPVPDDDVPPWLPHAPAEIPVTDSVASLEQDLADYVQAQAAAPAAAPGLALSEAAPAFVPELHRVSAEPAEAPAAAEQPGRLVVSLAAASAPTPLRAAGADHAMPLPLRAAAEDAPRPAPLPPRVVAAPPVARPVPPDPAHAELSFLRDAAPVPPVAPPATAQRTRLLWSLAAGLALVLLLWQWAVHERDRLAAAAPGLRPLLGALCAPLSCSVQPLRRIDAIVIDGSAFQALGDGGYRLSLTLRNRAAHAVALPAIALTLTDIAEQPVLRRVLLPQELGSPPAALDAHGEWTAGADLQIADNAGRARVVGYRLDPFYP